MGGHYGDLDKGHKEHDNEASDALEELKEGNQIATQGTPKTPQVMRAGMRKGQTGHLAHE